MKIGKINGSLSTGQKSKFPAMALGLSLAMTAPTWGQDWDGGGVGDEWNTADNWNTNAVPTGGDSTRIDGAFSVVVNAPALGGFTRVYNGADLTINANLTLGDDLIIRSGSTVTMNAGTLTISTEKLKIGESGLGTFYMKGGTVSIKDDFEFFSGLIEFSGGSWTSGWEGAPLEFDSGAVLRVIGDGATLINIFATDPGNGTYEFVPNAAGGITPITSGDTKTGLLSVKLDALTAPASMTLFTGGHSDVFLEANTSITQGATTLTLGAEGALGLNEYYLAGQGSSDDLVLSFNIGAASSTVEITSIAVLGNGDVVLTTDVPAAGLTAQQSEDLLTSFTDVASTPLGNTLTIDSLLVDPNADGADFFRVRTN